MYKESLLPIIIKISLLIFQIVIMYDSFLDNNTPVVILSLILILLIISFFGSKFIIDQEIIVSRSLFKKYKIQYSEIKSIEFTKSGFHINFKDSKKDIFSKNYKSYEKLKFDLKSKSVEYNFAISDKASLQQSF